MKIYQKCFWYEDGRQAQVGDFQRVKSTKVNPKLLALFVKYEDTNEVFEETGFDASGYLRENEYVERVIRGQRIRLFILSGLLEDTEFITQTRKEIGVFWC